MPGPANALEERRNPVRRSNLAGQIDVTDVDPELERCGRHERFELSRLEPRLGIQPLVLRQAAVVRCHGIFAKPLAQLTRDALGHPARVDEDQRRAMRLNQLRQAIVVLLPDFMRHHRFEGGPRNLEIEIDGSPMPLVDDRAIGEASAVDPAGTHQKPRDLLDGPLRGRQADPDERRGGHLLQTLQAEGQMRASPSPKHRVDLVDDHRPNRPQHCPAPLGCQEQIQGFGSRHQDVRRRPQHRGPFGL